MCVSPAASQKCPCGSGQRCQGRIRRTEVILLLLCSALGATSSSGLLSSRHTDTLGSPVKMLMGLEHHSYKEQWREPGQPPGAGKTQRDLVHVYKDLQGRCPGTGQRPRAHRDHRRLPLSVGKHCFTVNLWSSCNQRHSKVSWTQSWAPGSGGPA